MHGTQATPPDSHWESVYLSKGDAELSWLQAHPAMSLDLVRGLPSLPRTAIDIGGGQSSLAGELVALGIGSVSVLDISRAALDRGRQRIGAHASHVTWIECDVLAHGALGPFELWHDRACFHFLTDDADRRSYAELAARSVPAGGHAIIAGFGPEGPERCSGLPVRRTSAQELASAFAPAFALLRAERETHVTPWGKPQQFEYALLQRIP